MDFQHLLLTLIIIVVMTLFITRWVRIEVTVILTLAMLPLTGLLSPDQAFQGFASPATITIASMFVLSAGMMRTGALDFLKEGLRKHAKGSQLRLFLLLAAFVPLASAFVNNTPVVVMLVPILLELCREMDIKPSRIMIPLSFLAILGGTCTLIGTNTNILVDQLYREAGGDGFAMFDFTRLGLVYLIGGVLFLIFIGPKLLPERSSLSAMLSRKQSARFVTEVCLPASCKLLGRQAGEVFGQIKSVKLLEMVRGEEVIMGPGMKETPLAADDVLLVEGDSRDLAEFMTEHGVTLPTVVEDNARVPMHSLELMMGEAVVLPGSPFVGLTMAELELNRRYGVKVLAVMRRGRHHRYKIRTMVLKPGDVLLIQASDEGFNRLRETGAVLIAEELESTGARTQPKRWTSGLIMIGVVVTASFTPLPLVAAALLGVALLIILRCLRFNEALAAIDTTTIFILAGTIPLGLAMQETGLAGAVVDQIVGMLHGGHPVFIISIFYLMTATLTQLLSNQATAVLLTPIALSLATQLGVHPEPLLMAICFGASASFMTPIGYATNTIVMGPGGYTFTDYLKIGVPLNLLTWFLASVLIPFFWPL